MTWSPGRRPVWPHGVADFTDPYLDPATGILRNLTGATTWDQLASDEAQLVHARALQLSAAPVPFTADLIQLKRIHRHLFQDVYDWAGQIRTVDIAKPGSVPFLPASLIARGAEYTFEQLAQENLMARLDTDRFVDRLAFHYDQVNHLHPFREGNGRTQRIFFSQLAQHAGYRIDWARISGPANDDACRTAATGNLTPLRTLFADAVSPAAHIDAEHATAAGRAAAEAARVAGLGFPISAAEAVRSPAHGTPASPTRAPGREAGRDQGYSR